ncbi:calcium-binding protein, partial [Pseudovibrio sp. WM33]|uniref:calcium-binding protein n=1 Tax=Pseudovibrio sp. WM33 TaxID=1735585 RepID=UPI0023AA385B
MSNITNSEYVVASAFDSASALNDLTNSIVPELVGRSGLELEEFLSPDGSAYQTYNFEVEETHTYIAGGIRVHNKSILSFLKPHEFALITDIRDVNGDKVPDYVVLQTPDKTTEIQKFLSGDTAITEVTTSDGKGNIIFFREVRDQDGNVIAFEKPRYLTGQFAGEAVGHALTPFLTQAILGEDANPFETIVTDTILDTVLGNVGEVVGALVHRAYIDYGEFSLGEHLETITNGVFEDFGGELIVNGVDNVVGLVNQLVMAEIFEFIDVEGVPGAIFEAVVGAGINNVLTYGVDWLVDSDAVKALFGTNVSLYEQVNEGIKVASLPQEFTGVGGWASLILGAVVNEILPDLETIEGTIASAVTSALLSATNALVMFGSFAGPIGAVIAWAVGFLVDILFDEDPQAWTSVGFNAETGRFELTGTWSKDDGDTELSEALAQAYVDGMNGFIDTVMSQSHNYGELAQWSFGHFEEELKNAGKNGRSFSEFQDAYLDAYVRDLAKVQLADGQMTAVRALVNLDVSSMIGEKSPLEIYKIIASTLQVASDYHTYLENTEAINAIMAATPDSSFAAGWYATIAEAKRLGLTDSYNLIGDELDNEFYTGESDDTVAGGIGNDLIKTYLGNDLLQGEAGDDELHGGAGEDTLEGGLDNDTLEGGQGADHIDGGEGVDWLSFDNAGAGVAANLFEKQGISGEAEGDVYLNIENMRGSKHADELTGDMASNVMEGGAGDDKLLGHGGDDILKGQDGNDVLHGDLITDTSVGGNDRLYGEDGDDVLHGGGGFDKFFGGTGHDRAAYQYSTLGVIASLLTDEAKISGGLEQFVDIEGLIGSAHTDLLKGDKASNSLEGLGGDDVLEGGEGGDTYRYRLGDGNDVIYDHD